MLFFFSQYRGFVLACCKLSLSMCVLFLSSNSQAGREQKEHWAVRASWTQRGGWVDTDKRSSSFCFPLCSPHLLPKHSDHRGSLEEPWSFVTFFSSAKPHQDSEPHADQGLALAAIERATERFHRMVENASVGQAWESWCQMNCVTLGSSGFGCWCNNWLVHAWLLSCAP